MPVHHGFRIKTTYVFQFHFITRKFKKVCLLKVLLWSPINTRGFSTPCCQPDQQLTNKTLFFVFQTRWLPHLRLISYANIKNTKMETTSRPESTKSLKLNNCEKYVRVQSFCFLFYISNKMYLLQKPWGAVHRPCPCYVDVLCAGLIIFGVQQYIDSNEPSRGFTHVPNTGTLCHAYSFTHVAAVIFYRPPVCLCTIL